MTAPAAQPGNWVDPHRSYNFELIIDKVASGHFTADFWQINENHIAQ